MSSAKAYRRLFEPFKCQNHAVSPLNRTMTTNRQNLSRPIPEAVKREVRQRDGFGCIVCGSSFYQYDHLGTEFKDAETHDPQQIVLLCGGCHDRKNRGALSTETIQMRAKSPHCMQANFSWGPMDVGHDHPEIILGTLTARNVRSLLTIDGEDVFSISRPLVAHGPFTVNASLYDKDGRQTIKIVSNEFQVMVSNWDVEVTGARVTVRSAPAKFDLVIRMEPPHRLVIERLDMVYKNFSIQCREGQDTTIEGAGTLLKASGATFDGCDIAIRVSGSSLSMGVGGGSMHIQGMVINPTNSPRRLEPVTSSSLPMRNPVKQGRNERCRCGSGKKYKHCHGLLS